MNAAARMLLASLACAVVAAAATVHAAEYPSLTVTLNPVRVSEHAYYVQGRAGVASAANEGFNSNAGFVITPAGVVVIDALGTPALGNQLLKAIRSITPLPVRRVILTHYHADHFYGLQALRDAGAEIWAHGAAREYLDSGEAQSRLEQRSRDLFPWVDQGMKIVRPDHWLGEDEKFTLGGIRFETIHLGPAHSPEDVIVVVENDRVIFSGDILFTGRVPFVGDADSRQWLATFGRLLQLKPRLMVPGHGDVSRDPERDLALTRDYLNFLREKMGAAVENFVPFEDVYASTDWSRFSSLPAFDAANRVNAYGTYLLMEKESLARR